MGEIVFGIVWFMCVCVGRGRAGGGRGGICTEADQQRVSIMVGDMGGDREPGGDQRTGW